MNRTATIIFLAMVVIVLALNVHAFFKLTAFRTEKNRIVRLQEDLQARIRNNQLVRRSVDECRRQNHELENSIQQLVDSFYRYDQPLPVDTFSSEYQLGFFAASGLENFHIHVWIPAGKSVRFAVKRRHHEAGSDSEPEKAKTAFTFDEAGWHSVECQVTEADTGNAMLLKVDGKEIMRVNLNSQVYSRSVQHGGGNFGNIWLGNIWSTTPQIPGKQSGTITWKAGTRDEDGTEVHDIFEIEAQASR